MIWTGTLCGLLLTAGGSTTPPAPNYGALAICWACPASNPAERSKQSGWCLAYDPSRKLALVATNAHLLYGIRQPLIWCGTGPRAARARVVYCGDRRNELDDILLLAAPCEKPPQVLPIGQPTTINRLVGFPGMDRRGVHRLGRLVRPGQRSSMVIQCRADSGHSGGPLINSRGQVAGMCWGSDGQQTYAVPAWRIKQVAETATAKPEWKFFRLLLFRARERVRQQIVDELCPQQPIVGIYGGGGACGAGSAGGYCQPPPVLPQSPPVQLPAPAPAQSQCDALEDRLGLLETQVAVIKDTLTDKAAQIGNVEDRLAQLETQVAVIRDSLEQDRSDDVEDEAEGVAAQILDRLGQIEARLLMLENP